VIDDGDNYKAYCWPPCFTAIDLSVGVFQLIGVLSAFYSSSKIYRGNSKQYDILAMLAGFSLQWYLFFLWMADLNLLLAY
jgi:hypothetical protein